jgi:hypothetical protein
MIWSSICCRLIYSQSTLQPFGRFMNIQIPDVQSNFQGILDCLRNQCEDNVDQQGAFEISVSGTASGDPIEVGNFDHASTLNSPN